MHNHHKTKPEHVKGQPDTRLELLQENVAWNLEKTVWDEKDPIDFSVSPPETVSIGLGKWKVLTIVIWLATLTYCRGNVPKINTVRAILYLLLTSRSRSSSRPKMAALPMLTRSKNARTVYCQHQGTVAWAVILTVHNAKEWHHVKVDACYQFPLGSVWRTAQWHILIVSIAICGRQVIRAISGLWRIV